MAAVNQFEEWEYPPDVKAPRADLGGLSLHQLAALKWEELGGFKLAKRFPHGYPEDTLTFFAPRDPGVHEVIMWTILQCTQSLVVNMYGFNDTHAADLIRQYTENHHIAVTMSLDDTMAAGPSEAALLKKFNNDLIGNSIAIGRSIRGAISHNKLLVVDGVYVISGSTNWSYGGERKQDNQLTLSRNPMAAAEARAIIDLDHDAMLKQMAKKRPKDQPALSLSADT